ncbi:MAG: hypothetical protein AABZ02_00735 [Bacteroidota bacterium]
MDPPIGRFANDAIKKPVQLLGMDSCLTLDVRQGQVLLFYKEPEGFKISLVGDFYGWIPVKG